MADCFLNRHVQSNPYAYGENLFDFNAFRTKLSALPQPAVNGTVTWLDNGFTLTASSDDCYTWFADGTAPYLEVKRGKLYELSCDANGSSGYNYIFFDYPPTTNQYVHFFNEKSYVRYIFRTLTNTTKITLRFGVQGTGNSCTYSNIKLRQIL